MNSQTTAPEPSTKNTPQRKRQAKGSLPTLAKTSVDRRALDVLESMLWRINAKAADNDTQAVGITSCAAKSGASAIASTMASLASEQQNGRVLLIDANWQKPGLLKTFNLGEAPGLYDILSGELSPREWEPQTISEHLDVMCRGSWGEEQPTTVRTQLVDELFDDLKTDYALIIVDLPAAEDLRCALPIARKLNGSLLITRFESVKQSEAQRALRRLHEDGVTVWGSILNRHREYIPKWLRNWL